MHKSVKGSIDSIVGLEPIFTEGGQKKVLSNIKSKSMKKDFSYFIKRMPTLLGVVTIVMIGSILLLNILNDNKEIAESPVNPSTVNEPGSSGKLPSDYTNHESENDFIKENKDLIEEYEAIINIFQDYELPTEGIVKEELNVIYFENGYHFHIPTKQFVGMEYDPEVGPSEPTDGQILGVILGLTAKLKAEIDLETYQWDPLGFIKLELERLYKVKQYAGDYNPIKAWANETISYLEDSQALLDSNKEEAYQLFDKAMKLINDFHTAAELANMDSFELPKMEKEDVVSRAEIEELAKNNPNILPAPEYYSVDEFIAEYVKLLNRENKELMEATDKYTYEQHVVTTAHGYAKHFLELTESKTEQEKLEKIKEITDVVFEKMRVNKLDELTLETSFNELRTTMNNYVDETNKSQ